MSVASKLGALRQIWQFDNRWQLLLARFLFRHDPIAVYRLGQLQFVVDHTAGDASGAPDVLTKPMYVEHLAHLGAAQPAAVLDIGANTGGFPLFLAHHGVALARVVSVELNPRTSIRLRFNLERNLSCPVTVINAGLCGATRPLELQLGEGSVADSLYGASFNATGATTTVPGLTFDDLHAQAFGDGIVDICKIDVEFAEYEVLSSPGHDRLRRCRLLVVEIHEDATHARSQVADAIVALGFEALPLGSDRSVYVFRNTSLPGAAPAAAVRR
ncbi:MAG: FkbM family methyltransferase [Vicinamibacteraceae bacterium]